MVVGKVGRAERPIHQRPQDAVAASLHVLPGGVAEAIEVAEPPPGPLDVADRDQRVGPSLEAGRVEPDAQLDRFHVPLGDALVVRRLVHALGGLGKIDPVRGRCVEPRRLGLGRQVDVRLDHLREMLAGQLKLPADHQRLDLIERAPKVVLGGAVGGHVHAQQNQQAADDDRGHLPEVAPRRRARGVILPLIRAGGPDLPRLVTDLAGALAPLLIVDHVRSSQPPNAPRVRSVGTTFRAVNPFTEGSLIGRDRRTSPGFSRRPAWEMC